MKKIFNSKWLLLGAFLVAIPIVWAVDSYQTGTNQTIEVVGADGTTYDLTNTSTTNNYFVPNKTLAEWNAFKSAVASIADLSIAEAVDTYRYFRFQVTASNGQAITLGELEILVDSTPYPTANMTSNTTPEPLVVTFSSAQVPAYKAFDGGNTGSGNDWWYPVESQSYPEWLQIDLGAGNEIAPTSFKLYAPPANTNMNRTPKDFSLLASNTGNFSGEEVTLRSVTGQTGWSFGEVREFTIP